ncbi:uncharacterized protein LOC129720963 [Wyeomyia smithii]|uniref:uncharacterized protein LOC129720963 n=1 Tax=Wyeomyia smithii TaxID=174621 RepID=UPI002467DED3|nr:uncharacterized protein LOC129720963 [Wyeomyia smithii]
MTLGKVLITIVVAASLAEAKPPASHEHPDFLETTGILQEIAGECRNATGGDKAFHQLMHVLHHDTPRCFSGHVNMSILQTSVDHLSKQEQSKMLEQVCGQFQKSLSCIDPIVDKLEPCITDLDDILQKIVDTVPEALSLVCNNSAAMLLKLREPLSRSCAIELAPALGDCMDFVSNKTIETDLKKYTITECNEIYKMRDCVNNQIRDCGALSYLELFSLFYRNLLSLTPCK